jgi:hypothetical protein
VPRSHDYMAVPAITCVRSFYFLKLHIMMTTGADGTPSRATGVEKLPSPRHCKVCGHHICPGLGIQTDKECSMFGAHLYSLCAAESF